MMLSIEEEKQRMEEIYKLSTILIENKENSLKELLEAACKILKADLGLICLKKGKNFLVENYFCISPINIDKDKLYSIEKTFCNETLSQNKLLAIPDTTNYTDFDTNGFIKIKSYIGIPINSENKEIGTINFASEKVKKNGFSQREIDLMKYLNQWISHHLNRKFYKESLSNNNLELERKNQALEEIMQENKQLMQILVHDLKSPLSNIKMLSYLFNDFARDPESEELLSIFNKSLDYVFHLIEQMETLNNVENSSLKNYIEEFDLDQFIQDIIKDFYSSAQVKGININYAFSGKKKNIKTDMNFLKRVLHNLISNALKFSPFNRQIFVVLSQKSNYFEITIRDEGPGIEKDEQDKLFEKFTKLNNRPTNAESSSGLGLFIVKELLNNLKGEIKVETELGKGSSFVVKLPLTV